MIPILLPIVIIFGVFLGTTIFQWLWNITMPDIFRLRAINFWQALRLLLIATFITSGGFVRFNFGG